MKPWPIALLGGSAGILGGVRPATRSPRYFPALLVGQDPDGPSEDQSEPVEHRNEPGVILGRHRAGTTGEPAQLRAGGASSTDAARAGIFSIRPSSRPGAAPSRTLGRVLGLVTALNGGMTSSGLAGMFSTISTGAQGLVKFRDRTGGARGRHRVSLGSCAVACEQRAGGARTFLSREPQHWDRAG
jgi:hypothetical protein